MVLRTPGGGAAATASPVHPSASTVHAVQRLTRSPSVFAPLVEVVAVGQRTTLDSQERNDAVLGRRVAAVLPRRGRPFLLGLGQRRREALKKVVGEVLREAGIGAGRVVARVLRQEALELVGEVGGRGSGVELTELSPVGQRTRGGKLRATGQHRSVHHWAMPTHRGEAEEEEEGETVCQCGLNRKKKRERKRKRWPWIT